ncbi:MAG TPA: hypothetical protein VGG02_13865 [Chthoniobacterales bacterium]|jgi:hypothetical protein
MALRILDGGTVQGLRQVSAQIKNPRRVLIQAGGRAKLELTNWFRQRDRTPNKLGGPPTHYWSGVADSLSGPTPVGPGSVRISVTDKTFNQKVYGGPITPKTKEALTIPVAPEAYDMPVTTFQQESGIELFRLKNTGGVLTNALAGKLPSGDIKVFYILSGGVNQNADPDALPPRDLFNAAVLDEADQTLRRALNNAGASA